jgi:hypothetical protein
MSNKGIQPPKAVEEDAKLKKKIENKIKEKKRKWQ